MRANNATCCILALTAVLMLGACAGDAGWRGTPIAQLREVEPPKEEPTENLEKLTKPLRDAITGRDETQPMTREEVVRHIGMDPYHAEHVARRKVEDGVLLVQDFDVLMWPFDRNWTVGPDLVFFGGGAGREDGQNLLCVFDNMQDGVLVTAVAVDEADVPTAEAWGSFSNGVGTASSAVVAYASWQVMEAARGVEEKVGDIADSASKIDTNVGDIEEIIDSRTAVLEGLEGVDLEALQPLIEQGVQQFLNSRLN